MPVPLQRRRPAAVALILLALVVLAVAAACGSDDGDVPHIELGGSPAADTLMGVRVSPEIPKADFTLTGTSGEPYDFAAETEGQVTMLFFGYTFCPDICPTHMAMLASVLSDLPADVASRVTVVFVTTDPARDTPERLKTWLSAVGNEDFVGLTGTQEEVDAVQRLYRMEPAERVDLGGGNYSVSHGAYIMAFEPDGFARVVYPGGVTRDMFLNDIPILAGAAPEAPDSAHQGPDGPIVTAGSIEISGVSARETTAAESAVYLSIRDTGRDGDRLLSAYSPSAADTQIHENVTVGGAMQMRPVDGLDIPAGEAVVLAPGGFHIMLLGVYAPLHEGQFITVELTFERAGTVTVAAPVTSYADASHGGHGN